VSETLSLNKDGLRKSIQKNGLAPWQEARAKKMLQDNLMGDISLTQLAGACGLSVAFFARAFKNSTGFPPHSWLTKQRIEKAMSLMLKTDDALVDIALTSGFADQSHFTRVFTKTVGISPGAWRRIHRLSFTHAVRSLEGT